MPRLDPRPRRPVKGQPRRVEPERTELWSPAANPGAIQSYLDTLSAVLAFDPVLSRRAREEVEDHLRESVSRATGAVDAAERDAVGRFGPVRDIAARFAAVSLTRQTQNGGIRLMLGVLGIYAVMKIRIAWWAPAGGFQDWHGAAVTIPLIRAAFWVALVIGLLGWVYASRTLVTASPDVRTTSRLRRAVLLCAGATVAVFVSVTGDAGLAAVRFASVGWSSDRLIPTLLLASEVLLAVLMILHCAGFAYRAAAGVRLLHVDRSMKVPFRHDPTDYR